MSCSTAPISGVSRSRKLRTAPSTRRAPSAGSPQPQRRADPGLPVGAPRHLRPGRGCPTTDGLHRLPDVDVGVAGDQHVRAGHRRRGPGLLAARPPGGRPARPSRRCGPGPNSATAAARSSMPCIGSTTTPSTRRSCPHTRSTSSASCRPSTQIRAARAVRAACPATCTDPDADRAGAAGARRGRHERGRRAVDQERRPGAAGTPAAGPCRSSRVTSRLSAATTAPQNPLAGSSTTSPASAGTSGTARRTRLRVPSAPNDPPVVVRWAPPSSTRPAVRSRQRHARADRGADLRLHASPGSPTRQECRRPAIAG